MCYLSLLPKEAVTPGLSGSCRHLSAAQLLQCRSRWARVTFKGLTSWIWVSLTVVDISGKLESQMYALCPAQQGTGASLSVWSAMLRILVFTDCSFVTEIPLGEQGHWPGSRDTSPSWWTERNHGSKHRYLACSCAMHAVFYSARMAVLQGELLRAELVVGCPLLTELVMVKGAGELWVCSPLLVLDVVGAQLGGNLHSLHWGAVCSGFCPCHCCLPAAAMRKMLLSILSSWTLAWDKSDHLT